MTPDELKREWESGDALRVGEALLKPLAPAARVAIAADVLRVCASVFKPVPEVDQVLAISVNRGRWPEAHGAFQALRRRALAEKDKSLEAMFLVAENVAKTIYNASGQPAPFDADSPYRVLPCARDLARLLKNRFLDERLWTALTAT